LEIASLTEKIRDIFCNAPDLFGYLVAISTFILIYRHVYFFAASARTADFVSAAGSAIEVRRDKIPARSETPATSVQSTSIAEMTWLEPKSARAACATVLTARSPAEAQKAVLVSIYCFLSL